MGQIGSISSLLLDTISVQDQLKSHDGTLTGFPPIFGAMPGPVLNSLVFHVLIDSGSINPPIHKLRFYVTLGSELGFAFTPDSNHGFGPIEMPFWIRSSSSMKYDSMVNRHCNKRLNGATFSNDHPLDGN